MLWIPKKINLPYRLGFKELGRGSVAGIVCQTHVSALPLHEAQTPPLVAMRKYGVGVAHYPSCPCAPEVPALSRVKGCLRYVVTTFPHYITEIRGSYEDYALRVFSSRRRKKFRRLERRWREFSGGEIDVREYQGEAEIEAFLPLAESVSVKTKIHRHMGRGVTTNGDSGRRIREAASRGSARGYLLFRQDEPVAFDYAELDRDGILRVELVGYAPEYGQWEVGTLLNLELVRRVHDDPEVKVLDYCEGEAQYKARFATRRFDAAEIVFFRPTPRNLLIFGSHLALTQGYLQLRKLLLKSGTMDLARRLVMRGS